MEDLQSKAFQILGSRGVWEQKQNLYYTMRHDGMRRINKPFPNAADSHFPLIDMQIGNLKPFWMGQAFSGDRLADFVCMRQQLEDMTEAAADFMSFELRHRTDFRYEMEMAVDTMLLRGRGVLKIVYDPFKQKIVIRAVDPLNIIMADQYDDFEDADWFVEIQEITVPQYKRNRNFNQDEAVIGAIRGKTEWNLSQFKYLKQVQEGVTHSTREDIIVLWNCYTKTPGGYTVQTKCPVAWDKGIRKPYGIPYKFDGETLQPFYSLTMEIKNRGWYSPRGIAELNAAFEGYCTKLWNEKSDAMTYGNRPLFTSDGEQKGNGANIRFMPGELIPGNIKAVQMPAPAFDFAEEINFTRGVSEQRSRMPDYGVMQPGENGAKPRTATENNRIAALQDVGADHNGDIFRTVRLLKIYRHIWALICHREKLAEAAGQPGRLAYYVADNLKTLPAEALHDQYLVLPAGSGGTKQARLQRAVQRFSLFKGAPNVDQDELTRDVLAADDGRLVKRLLIPSSVKAQSEAFQEDVEIIVLSAGRPVPVLPQQDHVTRIKELVGYLEKQHVAGAPVDPIAKQRIQEHLGAHFQMLQQTNPTAAKQLKMALIQMEQQARMAGPGPGGPGAAPSPGAMPPTQPADGMNPS